MNSTGVGILCASLTGASVLVGHVDVNVRGEPQHGADDIIAAFTGSPHEGRPPLQIRLVLHRRVGQEDPDRLLREEKSRCSYWDDYEAEGTHRVVALSAVVQRRCTLAV